MPTYTRKVTTVEARQYEGPDLIVMSDAQGEQIAKSGDFLVGIEPRKVTVWAKDKFLAEFDLAPEVAPAPPAPPADSQAASTETTETHE